MPTLTCCRCSQSKAAMDAPPFRGALGQRIHDSVCADCWAEWRDMQTKIINEYRLSLGNPKSQEMLDREMKTFLNLPDPA